MEIGCLFRFRFLMALATTSLGGGVAFADPVNYWNVGDGGNVWAEGNLRLDDGSVAAWTNGNVLIAGTRAYPSTITGGKGGLSVGDEGIEADGVKYFAAGSTWTGKGVLSIGAGGFDTRVSPAATELQTVSGTLKFRMGGVRLTASQTWRNWSNVMNLECPVTAAEGVETWTLETPEIPKYDAIVGKTRFYKDCDLRGVTVVLRGYKGLLFGEENGDAAAGSLNADVIRIEGGNAHLVYTEAAGNAIDSRYAKTLELADGASPCLLRLTSVGVNDWEAEPFASVVYDLEAIRVVSGASALGDGYEYSVKDGGDLSVTVAEGATLTVASTPTAGRLVVTGAGTLALGTLTGADVDFSGFTGAILQQGAGVVPSLAQKFGGFSSVTLSNCVLRIDSVADYARALVVKGASRIALPRTADWPEGFSVVAGEDVDVYLPKGEAVDESKISGGEVKAVGRGMTAEGDATLSAGEELVVCGDGFAAGTTLALKGGKLVVAFDAEIASDVAISDNALTISVWGRATAKASGAWTWKNTPWLTIANSNQTVNSVPCNGRLEFTGTGSMRKAHFTGGDIVFSGPACRWTFSPTAKFDAQDGFRYFGVLGGAQVVFEDCPTYNASAGLRFDSGEYDMPCLEVGKGSLLAFGVNRFLELGGTEALRYHVTVKVDGGTLRFDGSGGALYQCGTAGVALTDATTHSPQVDILVTNGGVIETDRTFATYPVVHKKDRAAYMRQRTGDDEAVKIPAFTAGTFLTLDGGTYKVGKEFGLSRLEGSVSTAKSRNVLFAGVAETNTLEDAGLDYTAEISVTVGANGGTFDLSQAQAGVTEVTNTILGAQIPASNATGGLAPTLGPRWTLDGCLTVKGRGGQTLVVNGLDAAALKKLRADGATLKVVSDSAAALDEMTLGAPAGGGLVVEPASEAQEAPAVSIASLAVAAGGFYDASFFDAERTTVARLAFGDGATLCARGNPAARLSVAEATLASEMGYWTPAGSAADGTVLTAGSVVAPEGGVVWTKRDGSRRRSVSVTDTGVEMKCLGTVMIVR